MQTVNHSDNSVLKDKQGGIFHHLFLDPPKLHASCTIDKINSYTARPKKSHHLDLTKQVGKILPLDNYCTDDCYVPKEWGQLTWIYWMTRLLHISLMARTYSKMKCQDSSGSNCKRVVQGAWTSFHTWTDHHRVQSQTLTPRNFGMCWSRLCAAVRLYHHQYKVLANN